MWRIALLIIVLYTAFTLFNNTLPAYSASFADIIIDDMKLPNEGKPHGVPGYDWETHSVNAESTTFPNGFGAIQGWGDLYVDINGNPATNTRVAIRNFQTWWLSKSTNTWIRAQYEEKSMGGAAFEESYNGAKDGEIKMIDEYPTITAGGGYNFHFWHTEDGWNIPSPGDYKAIVTAFEAKLVKDNPSGTDDRAQAKFLVKSAVDTYVAQNNHGSDGKLPNFGIGRTKYATTEWKLFTHNSISLYDESVIRNNPPPIVVGADYPGGGGTTPTTGQITSPPGTCTKKINGDANCDGNIKIDDFAIWRSEFLKTLTTKLADFDANGTVAIADFARWRTTFLGANPTTPPGSATNTPPPGGATPTTPPSGACLGANGATVKILPLGDSVTDGTDGRGGYRFKLYTYLQGSGIKFDFVGPNKGGSVADNDHAGYGGYAAGNSSNSSSMQLFKVVPGFMSSLAPNVVLIMAGVNDIYNLGFSAAVAGQNVVDLAKQVNGIVPNAKIIVASQSSYGPQDDGGGDRGAINAAIKSGITALIQQGKPFVYAESMATTVTSQYTPQDVHPTSAGYDKMADVWWSYLNPLLCK